MEFPNNPPARLASFVRASTDANNNSAAVGGADPPTLDELRIQIPSARNAQSRIVSKEDLLARIFSMPANFGRVYRASIRNNPDNPNSALLYLLCRNRFFFFGYYTGFGSIQIKSAIEITYIV